MRCGHGCIHVHVCMYLGTCTCMSGHPLFLRCNTSQFFFQKIKLYFTREANPRISVCMYVYTHTHTHTQKTYIYIYIYIYYIIHIYIYHGCRYVCAFGRISLFPLSVSLFHPDIYIYIYIYIYILYCMKFYREHTL